MLEIDKQTMVNTLQKDWSQAVKSKYRDMYTNKWSEYDQKEFQCCMKAWMYSISMVVITALAITAIAAAGAALAVSGGLLALVVVGAIGAATLGITASIVGGIWIGRQDQKYQTLKYNLDDEIRLELMRQRVIKGIEEIEPSTPVVQMVPSAPPLEHNQYEQYRQNNEQYRQK